MGLCRLCLKESDDCSNLFSFKNGHLISDLVQIICPIIIIRAEVELPSKICNECLELIIDAIHLRDLSLMNDQELRRNIKNKKYLPIEIDLVSVDNTVETDSFIVEALEEVMSDEAEESEVYEVDSSPRYVEVPLEKHMAEYSRKNFCDICNMSFANSSSYKRHQIRKHSTAKFFCDQCPSTFKTKHEVEVHMRRSHLKHPDTRSLLSDQEIVDVTDIFEELEAPQGLSCTFCHNIEKDEPSMIEHLLVHQEVVDSGKMYCIQCPSAIPSMEFMIEHTKSHNEKMKTHRCLVCNKTFPFDDKFLTHLRNHKKNQHKICFCPECGRKFSKPRLMEDHIRFIHNKESLFCCPECGQGFGSKSALNGHIKRHIEGKKFQCPFCPRTFSSHNLLNSHKVVHSAERPYACTLCDKRFKHQKVLGDHMKRHDGTRPVFLCSICERTLNSGYALQRHMLTHTGSKPHQCEYCHKAYAQKNDLNKHLRTHIGENTYFCDFPGCNMSFRILADMRIHQGVHYVKG